MSSYPSTLQYTKEHEWIKIEGSSGVIGITSYAIEQLGDVVHLELPKVGARFKAGETFGTIESTKTVSDLYMPATGTISEINAALTDEPETITDDPHDKKWLIKVMLEGAPTGLLSASDYEKYIAEDSKH